jgi:hypothetical protein
MFDYVPSVLADISDLSPRWNIFYNLFEQEDIIFKKSAKSSETKYIDEANRYRRDLFYMVKRRVSSAALSFDADDREAAERLTEIVDNYKAIGTATMVEVSALITNMVQDLNKPRYTDALTKLGLLAVAGKLEEANERFRELYLERAQNLETAEQAGTMKVIRPKVDKAFSMFTEGLDAIYAAGVISGKDVTEAGKLIDHINSVIDQFERALAHRGRSVGGKKENADDEIEEPETPVPPPPTLEVSVQTVESANSMLLFMADQKAFEEALYPAAENGYLHLSADDINDYPDFHIAKFDVQGGRPTGILVNPPYPDLKFEKPLKSIGAARAEVFDADNTLLARLSGVEWPSSVGGM